MGKEPEVIERDIERSREDLSEDFDALADRVSPKRVAGRQVEAVKGRFSGMRDTVMGPARSAGGTMSSAKDTVAEQAEGNPLAAGLVAFSAGWLVSSLIPASEKEAQIAEQAVDAAKEHGQPLMDRAKTAGQEMGEELKGAASEAAADLKDSTKESAQHVKTEGQSSAQNVKENAKSS